MRRPRTAGEGTIRHRADGRWEARYYDSGDEGRPPRRRSVFAQSDTEVARKLREALTAKDQGKPLPGGQETVATFLRTWLEGAKRSLRPSTWARYEQLVRVHIVPGIGRVRLVALRPHHVQRLYSDLLERGVTPANVHHVHRVLRRALGQAEKWRLVTRNAAALVTPPRPERREMRTLTAAEARRLVDAAPERDRALYLLAVSTGMRLGELLGLHWADVDLDDASLRVVSTLRRVPGQSPSFGPPKTQKSRRRVELGPSAVEALRRHRMAQIDEQWRAGQLWEDFDLVFPTHTGRPWLASNVTRVFGPLLERADLPAIRFHDLRHTAATLMLGRGVHAKIVSDMLGHASISITLDTYSHVLPTMHREAARLMEDLLGDLGGTRL